MQLIDSDCTSSNTGFGDAVSPLNVSNISGAATRSGNEFALNPIGTNTLTYYNSSGQKLANLNFLNLPELSNDYTHFQGVNFPIVGTYINDSYYYGSFYSPEYYFHILVNRSTGEMHKIPALMKLSNYGKKFDFLFSNIVASYGNNFVSSVTYDKYNSVINSNSIISNHMEHIPVMQEGDFPMLVYYDFAF